MKVIINAANLHVGGGIQVAASFLTELNYLLSNSLNNKNIFFSVLCSSEVYKNLPSDFSTCTFCEFSIVNIYGLKRPSKDIIKRFDGFDVCFTVFGPLYFTPQVKFHICGFAQSWIAYPNNIAYKKLALKEWLKNKIKFKVQSFFFHCYDHLIVEQVHIKDALGKQGYDRNNISVVSNCVSAIFDSESQWESLEFDSKKLKYNVTLGFIGRPYSHKNISILNQVNEILICKFKMHCNFIFTFTETEMTLCGFSEKKNFFSVGQIKSAQCPTFYNLLDALVFPSLLECFSASPIEAMKMNTTVIASNYPFVSEVCGDAAFYFDPLSADDIATVIFNALSNGELRESKKKLGRRLINDLPTAKDRAISYLNIITSSIENGF